MWSMIILNSIDYNRNVHPFTKKCKSLKLTNVISVFDDDTQMNF